MERTLGVPDELLQFLHGAIQLGCGVVHSSFEISQQPGKQSISYFSLART